MGLNILSDDQSSHINHHILMSDCHIDIRAIQGSDNNIPPNKIVGYFLVNKICIEYFR